MRRLRIPSQAQRQNFMKGILKKAYTAGRKPVLNALRPGLGDKLFKGKGVKKIRVRGYTRRVAK